jgi:hypothetical protein
MAYLSDETRCRLSAAAILIVIQTSSTAACDEGRRFTRMRNFFRKCVKILWTPILTSSRPDSDSEKWTPNTEQTDHTSEGCCSSTHVFTICWRRWHKSVLSTANERKMVDLSLQCQICHRHSVNTESKSHMIPVQFSYI